MRTYKIYKQGIKTVIEVKDDVGNIIDRKEAVEIPAESTNGINGTMTIKSLVLDIPYDAIEGTSFNNLWECMDWMNANKFFMALEGVAEILQGQSSFVGSQTEQTVTAVGINADDNISATPIGDNNSNLTITNVINGAFTVVRTKKNILNDIVADLAFSWIRL